jgi:hypothetical protein
MLTSIVGPVLCLTATNALLVLQLRHQRKQMASTFSNVQHRCRRDLAESSDGKHELKPPSTSNTDDTGECIAPKGDTDPLKHQSDQDTF